LRRRRSTAAWCPWQPTGWRVPSAHCHLIADCHVGGRSSSELMRSPADRGRGGRRRPTTMGIAPGEAVRAGARRGRMARGLRRTSPRELGERRCPLKGETRGPLAALDSIAANISTAGFKVFDMIMSPPAAMKAIARLLGGVPARGVQNPDSSRCPPPRCASPPGGSKTQARGQRATQGSGSCAWTRAARWPPWPR
jgi:hypothetical protein